jgi:threonylcarbamoyladenosine tRNA methylthiotransferase CDKAL1
MVNQLSVFFPFTYSYNVVSIGTPAARMKKVPSIEVKKRSRELTSVFEAFSPYEGLKGKVERIWITEIATDGVHLVCSGCSHRMSIIDIAHFLTLLSVSLFFAQVGHTKGYIQVLVIAPDSMLGTSADAMITSVGRWSVFGEVIEGSVVVKETALGQNCAELPEENGQNHVEQATCSTNTCDSCACSGAETAAQQCSPKLCEGPCDAPTNRGDATRQEAPQSTLVRRNMEGAVKTGETDTATPIAKHQQADVVTRRSINIDKILWGGLAVSFATTVAVLGLLTYKISYTSS